MIVRLPYGRQSEVADLRGFRVFPLQPNGRRGAPDLPAVVRASLDRPVGDSSLIDRARGRSRVAIVVPDATRWAALPEILPEIITFVLDAGVQADGITVVIACGTHPAVPDDEARDLVGRLPVGVRLLQHDSRDHESLTVVGTTSRGLPIRIHNRVARADLRITVGAVRHHYFAGFGGGPKMIFPGVAGYEEIQANHSRVLEMSGPVPRRHPGCEPGLLLGNPVAEEIAEASSLCAADIAVCLAPGVGGGFAQAFSGSPEAAFAAAVDAVKQAFEVEAETFDLIVASAGGRPCDSTLIQAQKGLDAACRFLNPDGGELLFVAALDEGAGSKDMLPFLEQPRPQAILERLALGWVQYGHTTLRIIENTARHTVHLVSEAAPEMVSRLGFRPASTAQTVVEGWRDRHSGASVGVLTGAAVYPRTR